MSNDAGGDHGPILKVSAETEIHSRLSAATRTKETEMSDRDAYVEKMKAKLDEWNAGIAKLEAKTKGMEADAQIQHGE